jgi:hypothetical protein
MWQTSGVERLRAFDMSALFDALEAERGARGLGWAELMAEINEPFRGTLSIPISVGTIRSMRDKRSVIDASRDLTHSGEIIDEARRIKAGESRRGRYV